MATTGVFTAQGNITGGPGPNETFGPYNQTFSAAIGTVSQVALVNGTVTVTVPTGTTLAIFAPPNAVVPAPNPAYGGTINARFGGDTAGIPCSSTNRSYWAWDSGNLPASIVFSATAAGTGTITFF